MGGLVGGGARSVPVYMPPPAPAAPPPAPATVGKTTDIKPIEGVESTIKKPKTKGLLTGETLGSTTLLGS